MQDEARLARAARRSAWIASVVLCAWLVPGLAQGAEGDAASAQEQLQRLQQSIAAQQAKIEQQSRVLEDQARALDQQRQVLGQQRKALEALQERLGRSGAQGSGEASGAAASQPGSTLPSVSQGPQPPKPRPPEPAPGPAEPQAPPPAAGQTAQPAEPSQPQQEAENAEAERPKSQAPLEQLLLEAGAVLLPKGTLQVEPGLEYDHYSNSFVALSGFTVFDAITIGTIRVDRVDQDVINNTYNLRWGVVNRFQVEGKVPLTYRHETDVLRVGTNNPGERKIHNMGLGDVETTLLWQALLGHGELPSLVLNTRVRFPTGESPFDIGTEAVNTGDSGAPTYRLKRPPTGSGFFSIAPGFNALWRTDPVVFFAGGDYSFNLARNQGSQYGNVDPGDQIEGFLGMNVSLSERVSLNFSFVDTYTWETSQRGHNVPGSSFNDGRMLIGTSIGVGPHATMILSAAMGLTEQSPDFQFLARVPFTFRVPFLANLFGE